MSRHPDAETEEDLHDHLGVFGEYDILMGSKKVQDDLALNVPGAAGQAHDRFPAGHFIQESQGEGAARRLLDFITTTP